MAKPPVDEFNKLRRTPLLPSGRGPNNWHFDVRYVALEPPSHMMLLFQTESTYIHLERLPIGLPQSSSGIAYFPETAEQAAPAVAHAILHSFVNNLDMHARGYDPNAPPPLAPWKLTAEDPDLARAVGNEMRSLGVQAPELHTVSVSSKQTIRGAREAFDKVFGMLRPSPAVKTPDAIVFRSHTPKMALPLEDEDQVIMQYVQTFSNAKPPREVKPAWMDEIAQEWAAKSEYLEKHPLGEVKADADAGNPNAMLDYAMRYICGHKCKPDRAISYEYLVRAIQSPQATAELKSTAHALLIDWHIGSCSESMPIRYMLAASHHAEHALRLAKEVSPLGYNASGAVLYFLMYLFRDSAEKLIVPELLVHYKTCWEAIQTRLEQMRKDSAKMQVKRMKHPNRYRCANRGCGIVSDKGKMLQQCSGKCDVDKKPAYCSKECQRADWKNHKPFCKPGMPCSVIDDSLDDVVDASGSSRDGAVGVRIPMGDRDRILMSSTLSPAELKSIRDSLAVESL
ncbi:hypothetical protein HDZ31DRAFT_42306 [Schizophyllum fasciatum]